MAAWLVSSRLGLKSREDRLTSKYVSITHEFLSVMLGVQRSGITIAHNVLRL